MKPKKTSNRLGAALTIRVMPRSGRNEIMGILEDGTVKIRLTAAPVEGKANVALIRYLADVLRTSTSNIEIVAGLTGKNKLVTILDLDPSLVEERIHKAISEKR